MSAWSDFWYKDVFDTHKDEDSGGGGGGDMSSTGGLSAEDLEIKKLLYGKLKALADKGYVSYDDDMYADRSQGELDLLETLKGGGGYQPFYDQASTNLGLSSDVYKKGMNYGTSQLDADTAALMGQGSTYRRSVADQVLSDMQKGAAMSGMNITANALGSGAFGGDRAMLAQGLNQQNYLSEAGRALGNLNMQAYNQSLNNAMRLRQGREQSARGYSDQVMRNLGINTQGLDKKYATSLGAYKTDRGYLDRDLAQDRKDWDAEQNFDYNKLKYLTGIYGGMPFEEKVVKQQPASGGK